MIFARQRRAAAAAQDPEEPLQDAEVGITLGLEVHLAVVQGDLAAHLELRAFAGESQAGDVEQVAVERELDRSVVLQRVVEQLEVETFDARVDDEMIDVRRARRRPGRCRPATAVVNGDSRGSKKRR